MPTHYIPDNLIAVARLEKSFVRDYSGESYQAREAFIVPEGSGMINSARDWAKRGGRWQSGNHPFTEEALPNEPMTKLRVVGCEHRGEGGMAYKVVTDQGYLVDLREPEFLSAFFNGQIDKNGYIKGSFVWSVGGNQMRIVEVGSDLYKERLAAGQAQSKQTRYLKGQDLEVGVCYTHAMGFDYWYAGRVRHNGKLKYGWWDSYTSTKTDYRKILIVTGSCTATAISKTQVPLPTAVLCSVQDGFGQDIEDITWQDGTPIKVWGK